MAQLIAYFLTLLSIRTPQTALITAIADAVERVSASTFAGPSDLAVRYRGPAVADLAPAQGIYKDKVGDTLHPVMTLPSTPKTRCRIKGLFKASL